MKMTHRGPGIFWMVRLLGALGFLMVAVMIGQSGLQLQSMLERWKAATKNRCDPVRAVPGSGW